MFMVYSTFSFFPHHMSYYFYSVFHSASLFLISELIIYFIFFSIN